MTLLAIAWLVSAVIMLGIWLGTRLSSTEYAPTWRTLAIFILLAPLFVGTLGFHLFVLPAVDWLNEWLTDLVKWSDGVSR
jgi:hypothetical protein